jgi:hypothetical protein
MFTRDRGNAYTRKPEESYFSPAIELKNQIPARISWTATVPTGLQLKFQVRSARTKKDLQAANWTGPNGEGSYFEHSGEEIPGIPSDAPWLQYRAVFVSPYGCGSPRLHEVRIDFKPH